MRSFWIDTQAPTSPPLFSPEWATATLTEYGHCLVGSIGPHKLETAIKIDSITNPSPDSTMSGFSTTDPFLHFYLHAPDTPLTHIKWQAYVLLDMVARELNYDITRSGFYLISELGHINTVRFSQTMEHSAFYTALGLRPELKSIPTFSKLLSDPKTFGLIVMHAFRDISISLEDAT